MKVLGISGSLRKDSHNSLLLESASRVMPADAELEIFTGLRDLPHYDGDFDDPANPDSAVKHLRESIKNADAILFVTPEYNGSIPGVLKNAVDWASRPSSDPALRNKPVAAIGASTGQFGGVWAQADLRRSLGIAGARVVDMEFAVSKAHEVRDQHGDVLHPDRHDELGELVETLVDQARINASAAAARAAA